MTYKSCHIQNVKTTESDRHPNPTTNPNPNPYLVAVRYGSLVLLPGSRDLPQVAQLSTLPEPRPLVTYLIMQCQQEAYMHQKKKIASHKNALFSNYF